MKSRALLVAVVLGTALVSGGWLVERGLAGSDPNTSDRARLFDEVFQHISRQYVDTLSDSALYVKAVDGLIGELDDPHSAYLTPKFLQSLSERTSGRYAGVGAQIDIRDGWITIVSPMPGGPALADGIHTGDRIIQVDGKEIRGVGLDEAQRALRGEPGSVVKLTVERPGVPTPLKFALTRSEIKVQSVQHAQMLGDGVGYVALTIFSEQSAAGLRQAIDSLRGAGMKTLLFDLRGDPGGLLDQGVSVGDLFLDPHQRIVSMKGRTADATRSFDDRAPQEWPTMPVAVLVDSNTASAAEIVAGALQDHDRAVLLGSPTYGKGSAQNVFPLGADGAVKLTTALWYTPSGRSINRRRISPDKVSPDTLTKTPPHYKTDSGRSVLGGGGIAPDVVLPSVKLTSSDTAFDRAVRKQLSLFRDALTDYALSMKANRSVSSPDFVVTPEMRAELMKRMKAHGVTVDSATYAASAALVDRLLGYEITRYVFGEPAEYARRLKDDPSVVAAVKFARGASTQRELLERAEKAAR
jgi:carboxyl-terminal processing protease